MSSVSLSATPTDWSSFTFADYKKAFPQALIKSDGEATFNENKRFVLAQNEKFAQGKATWYAAINEYSHLTEKEFDATKKGLKRGARPPAPLSSTLRSTYTPDAVDWRKHSPSIITRAYTRQRSNPWPFSTPCSHHLNLC